MCVTAVLAAVAVVAAAAGTATSISAANNNSASAEYTRLVQNKQAKEARDTAEIQALQQENARTSEYEKTRSSAIAAIGASGLGEQISYFQGIEPDSRNAYLRDVRSVRLNLTQQQSGIADQIQVNDVAASTAKANASASKVGAVAGFVQTAMSAANFYNTNKTPSAKPAGAGS